MKAFVPPTTATLSDKCTFLSIDQLFPSSMLSVDIKQGNGNTQIGNNYYGGWTKTVTVPDTKAYQYYVTRSDVIEFNDDDGTAGGWNAIKDGQFGKYEINICDNGDCSGYTGVPDTTGLELNTGGFFEQSNTYLKVIEEIDPDKQPVGGELINKLHGSFTCGASHGSTSIVNGMMTCNFYMPQLKWYFGVSSLCHHTTPASEANIFAWYVQPESEQKFILYRKGADEGGYSGLAIGNIDGSENHETDSPAEILFSAPVQESQTLSHPDVWGVQQVSWIRKVESTVKYSYSNQQGNAPPTRCKTTNSGLKLSVANDDGNQVDGLVDAFASDCKVSMDASIDVEFSDKYDDALCDTSPGSATGRQQAQIETTLIQFARIHENRTLPSLQNNSANRFFAAYGVSSSSFDNTTGLPDESLMPATGAQSNWACLDVDGDDDADCDIGDPFIVLGHRKVTVLKADAIDHNTNDTHTDARLKKSLSYTISANIAAATLSSPNTAMSTPDGTVGMLTPWSYVMGITDYTISECGAKNFDNDDMFDGEYPTTTGTTTTGATRRLGSAMPKSVIRKSVINFGSYKGFE
jgi:hypothetical protein